MMSSLLRSDVDVRVIKNFSGVKILSVQTTEELFFSRWF
jgi:hypothetical protein